jgi:hypothetical protein
MPVTTTNDANMKPLGILFKDEMVRAILDGKKRETRRGVKPRACPYVVGRLLWVKEAWMSIIEATLYRADEPGGDSKWCSSLLMPRRRSRIDLRVTSLRTEALGDITDEGAIREGFEGRAAFLAYVADIYKKKPKALDASVWVIGFERVK